jgi:hypothetical protein
MVIQYNNNTRWKWRKKMSIDNKIDPGECTDDILYGVGYQQDGPTSYVIGHCPRCDTSMPIEPGEYNKLPDTYAFAWRYDNDLNDKTWKSYQMYVRAGRKIIENRASSEYPQTYIDTCVNDSKNKNTLPPQEGML